MAPAIVFIAGFVVSLLGVALNARREVIGNNSESLGLLQPLHLFVSLYCAVNVLICLWEISLFLYHNRVKSTFVGYKKKLAEGNLPSPLFLFENIRLDQAASFEYWHDVWATYSLLDVSYSQEGSFGYNIDVGNGFSTLLPSLVFIFASCDPQRFAGVNPRTFGFVSALFFYQAMYGTIVYFFQYAMNKRWLDHKTPRSMIIFLVGGSNVFWIIGPIAGLYACSRMIKDNNTNVFFEGATWF